MFRRTLLIVFFLVAPPLLAWLLNIGTRYLLVETNRVVNDTCLLYAALVETAVFYWGAFMEVKDRWAA